MKYLIAVFVFAGLSSVGTSQSENALVLLHEIKAMDGKLQWVEFSPDGTSVAACGDKFVQAFNTKTGKLEKQYAGNKQDMIRFAYSPNGKWVASAGGDSTIHIWDAKTAKIVTVLREHTDKLIGVSFSPDSRFLASTARRPNDGKIRIWDTSNWKCRAWVKSPSNTNSMFVAISPDNKTVIGSGYRGLIRVFDFDGTSLKLRYNKTHNGGEMLPHIVFSPSGEHFVTSGWDKTLRKWSTSTGKEIWSHQTPPYARCFEATRYSKDGSTLYTVTRDETIQIRDAKTGKVKKSFRWNDQTRGIAVSPDGKLIATVGHQRTIKVWKVN